VQLASKVQNLKCQITQFKHFKPAEFQSESYASKKWVWVEVRCYVREDNGALWLLFFCGIQAYLLTVLTYLRALFMWHMLVDRTQFMQENRQNQSTSIRCRFYQECG